LLGADILLSLLLPISFVLPKTAYHISSKLAFGVWYGIQRIFTYWNEARVTTSRAELPQRESAIIIANHVSWTDFYLIQEMALRPSMLGSCRWFAKQQLK
jgi:1-acyl-sn-glycerol-3-phosphate acyltransferase